MEITREILNQLIAEVNRGKKLESDRRYARDYYLAHRNKILAKRRKQNQDPEFREKRRQYLKAYHSRRKSQNDS